MTNQYRWKIVEFSRTQIIKAGKTIRNETANEPEKIAAIQIIDNWRAAHAYPLHIIYTNLRKKFKKAIVAERLKRLSSILGKLKRMPTMSLWEMQDLGGCRVVVPKIEDVYSYAETYKKSRKRHILKRIDDHIKNPKSDGYRSLHLIYEYHSDKWDTYNRNMQIEIQFRTRLQHIWATAVETMGLFKNEAIKFGQGSEDVKRFFLLVSSLFAVREKEAIAPGTSDDINELVLEIKRLDERHKYLDFLSGIRVATEYQNKTRINKIKSAYYILILNYNKRVLNIKTFKASEFKTAETIYKYIEQTKADAKIDAVLVGASSFNVLRSAYPNYFSSIKEFVKIVKSYFDDAIGLS